MAETQRKSTRNTGASRYDEKAVYLKEVICGFPDEIDERKVTENKRLEDWKAALGQVLVYSLATGKKPAITLIAKEEHLYRLKMILHVYSHYGIDLHLLHEKDAQNPLFDKRQNWRSFLKKEDLLDLLRGQDVPSKVTKPELVVLATKHLRLELLSVPYLSKLAKAKGLLTTGPKAKLLAEVKQAWDDSTILQLPRDAPIVQPVHVTDANIDSIVGTAAPRINFRSMKQKALLEYAKEKGYSVPSYLPWEDVVSFCSNPSADLLEALTSKCLATDFASWTATQQRAYAQEKGIDISTATSTEEAAILLRQGKKKPKKLTRKELLAIAEEQGYTIPSKPYVPVEQLRTFLDNPSEDKLKELLASLE